jgi:hypothetical protein
VACSRRWSHLSEEERDEIEIAEQCGCVACWDYLARVEVEALAAEARARQDLADGACSHQPLQ